MQQVTEAVPTMGAISRSGDGIRIIESVNSAPLETAPFDHAYFRELFTPDAYRALLVGMPATEQFHDLKHPDAMRADGTSARQRLFLYPEQLWKLPAAQRAVWRPVAKMLCSRKLQKAFKQKFKRALEARFGCSIDKLSFYPVPILVRDLPGYKIGIHSDVQTKAITVQFYLPEGSNQVHLGTVFHEGRAGDAAKRVKKMSFLPATGYAFPVQQSASWHSAEETKPADGVRSSIMVTYYVQSKPRNWARLRLQRVRSFLGKHPPY